MEKIVKPIKALSFEEALRNLASRLTGTPVAELPRTQEAIVQYMAENINLPGASMQVTNENVTIQGIPGPDVDKMCEAITQEVMARLDMDALSRAVLKEVEVRLEKGVFDEAFINAVNVRLDMDALSEVITKKVMACISEINGANLAATEPSQAAQDGADAAGGTSTPPALETPQEAPQTATEAPKPKTTRKTTKAKAEK